MKSKLKNKFVKKILIIVLVILSLFVLSKIYHFVIINKLHEAIEDFRKEENRAYFVMTTMNGEVVLEEKKLVKQKIIKYINRRNNLDLNYVWKNSQNNEEYFINVKNNTVHVNDITFKNKDALTNLPDFIEYSSKENELDVSKIFDIHHIMLTKYENKICYKIVTKNEIIIIDKDTYLPVYSSTKIIDSGNGNLDKIENTYEFKVGGVTDEDVALPDLSEYTVVE